MGQPKDKGQINSNEKSSHWVLVIMGILFILISSPIFISIPEALRLGDYKILIVLIFPLAGLMMLFGGWRMRQ